jgi:uncharacterized lipoprotein NlpE involved in copper resistance
MRAAIFIFIYLSVLGACHSKAPAKDENVAASANGDTVNKINKPDAAAPAQFRYSSYSGILPCPDCQGIKITLNLMDDNSYQKLTKYVVKKGKKNIETLDETGRWLLRGKDTIYLTDVKEGSHLYLRTETYLLQLDEQGNRITGPQADQYILNRIK